jgi:multiple sugar transport system ATP-binding protein
MSSTTSKAETEAETRSDSDIEIKIEDLRKEFDVPGGMEVAVDDISIDIKQGEFVTLVGPSGCGKTTTLRCIAGLETPTSGKISHRGRDLTYIPANKRNFGMMFQNIALYPHMTVIDNISYPLKVRDVPKEERYEDAREAAGIMQISELLDKYPGELSGGQRQRAALARTLVQDPVAFLMDEPLSDLDAKLKVDIRKEIQKVHKRLNRSTIYVTHDQEEAMTMSDRIAVMNDGQIEQIGTRDDLYDLPKNMFVASFIGNPSINYLSGTVEELTDQHGAIDVYDQHFEFNVGFFRAEPSTDEVNVGFRPIAVSLENATTGGHFEGTLELLEPVDDRALASLNGPEGELRAHIPTNQDLEEDSIVQITIDLSQLYIFDSQTSELIARAA